MGWFRDFSEQVGEAIPNEFAKSNSWAKYIPYVGQISQALGGIDSAATAYADTRDKGAGSSEATWKAGQSMYSGYLGSRDPGIYGSPNVNRDPWNMAGQVGNIAGNWTSILNVERNPYFNKDIEEDYGQEPSEAGRHWSETVSAMSKVYRAHAEDEDEDDESEPKPQELAKMGSSLNDIIGRNESGYPLTEEQKQFLVDLGEVMNRKGLYSGSKLERLKEIYPLRNVYTTALT